ncbi:hypothetical protein [Massilia sp. CCM 8734]|uniref:hypothetical protein n=1 Tax=Massilia sp. CCM 8734 TaxID=2609283 RepID=UPI0014238A59|nr:hypothetical protein [Massilia sp. CCM 8734]NIA00208.1 hypothetical protein [Massilia sp. CCM 8734]
MKDNFDVIEDFQSISQTLNNRFLQELWLDFEIINLQNGILKIKASKDFCYFHDCEIEFSDVRYFSGPMLWRTSPNEGLTEILPKDEVVNMINEHAFETPCNAISFITETSYKVIIVCASIKVNFDRVYYFAKENLGLNERIAEDVDFNRDEVVSQKNEKG